MTAHDLIEKYAGHLRSESCSDRTIDERKATLARMDRDLEHGLDGSSCDELKAWLWRDGLSMGSRETYYGAFNSFYTWAADSGILDFNPAEWISRPKPGQRLPNPVTDQQLADALAQAREPYLTWVKLAAYAGLRCIDIANLRRDRITETGIRVIASKGGNARAIGTHSIIWKAVRDLPPGPITDLTARQISMRSWTYFHRTLKMPGVRMHRFRHWFGTMIQRRHKNLLTTMRLLGHTNPASTAGYALIADEDIQTAIDLLPTFDVGPAEPAEPWAE